MPPCWHVNCSAGPRPERRSQRSLALPLEAAEVCSTVHKLLKTRRLHLVRLPGHNCITGWPQLRLDLLLRPTALQRERPWARTGWPTSMTVRTPCTSWSCTASSFLPGCPPGLTIGVCVSPFHHLARQCCESAQMCRTCAAMLLLLSCRFGFGGLQSCGRNHVCHCCKPAS